MRQIISTTGWVACAALALLTLTPEGFAQVGIKRGGYYPGGSILNDNLGYTGGRSTSSSAATGYATQNRTLIQPGTTVGGGFFANPIFGPLANGNIVSQRPTPNDGRGSIVVKVPASAEVSWNGIKSTLKGDTRYYSTLPLSADGAVQNFEARWLDANGQAVSQRRDVRAMPNATVNVDFMRPEPEGKTPATN